MHATWNAIVKISGDRFVVVSLIDFMALLCLVPFAALFSLPNSATWGYVAASDVLNTFYRLFLIGAYQRGDLSQVYPIMRGSSPVFVAGLAFVFAGETLSAKE